MTTTFYFNSRENKDIQEYEGKQYNANYEFGGKVIENKDEKTIIEIRNIVCFMFLFMISNL